MERIWKSIFNIYIIRSLMIAVVVVLGSYITIATNPVGKVVSIILAVSISLGGTINILISIVQAKKVQKMWIVVVDLLFIIVMFATLYDCIYSISHSAFSFNNRSCTYLDLLYFSFMTFTTLGCEDVVALTYLAKFTSAIEAFMFSSIISIVLINFTGGLREYITGSKNGRGEGEGGNKG